MTTEVILPQSGMGIEEGVIVRWLKTAGETVRQGEILVEVETAKAIQAVEAPVSGRLVKIVFPENTTAAVNAVVALIEESDG